LNDNSLNFITIMFLSNLCAHSIKIKPIFISLAEQNPYDVFVYVDVNNFTEKAYYFTDKFNVQCTPYFVFYTKENELGNTAFDTQNLIYIFTKLKKQIPCRFMKTKSAKGY